MPDAPLTFDRCLYRRRRALSAHRFAARDFLHRRAMEDVIDRLETVLRPFPLALFYGAGTLTSLLTPACGVGAAISADLACERLGARDLRVVFDEDRAPLGDSRFDLIVSLLTLHAVNDPVGALAQMRRALKPDGLLVAVAFGEGTLSNLRSALYAAEAAATGRVAARVAPFAGVRDWGAALQRAGFALPVADIDRVQVQYRSASGLFSDLRGLGETCCLSAREGALTKATRTELLKRLGPTPEMTFEMATLTGWAPHESQPKPLKPGSAAHSLAQAVNGGASRREKTRHDLQAND
ncbi:MAG TPA: SAM-dependent methyltransferase [Parvularcula sp.]|nr:SAM-dependent methyltransferase [Parvularcula sp.]